MNSLKMSLFYGVITLLLTLSVGCRQETEQSEPELTTEELRAETEIKFAEYDAKAAKLPFEPIETNDDGILVLKDANFTKAVGESDVLVVDCWMDYCIPCEDMEPIIKNLARLYKDKVQFAKLHNSNAIMTEKYSVYGFPTFLFFVDGKYTGKLEGMQPSGRMQMVLDRILLDRHAEQEETETTGPQ